uniref:uncharacterized protein LOC122610117 n=1 Tax=Erigeron canadensis TaxID=72917 RepID=UPI001CB99FB8|nr:uncharacterized protein LOC122610117 [Erigeron canadensis]
MEQNMLVDNWVRYYHHKNQESEDDDEALSLCDLATNDHEDNESLTNHFQENEEHFDFGNRNLPQNKMCTADELFFQGQIMPVSGSKSQPVSVGSSRSSSTRSHNSATSGSSTSSSLSGPEFKRATIKNQNQNRNQFQFHSHPSPTPQIQTRSLNHNNSKSSSNLSKWRYFQLGPVKPQEIGLEDLKNRSQRSQGISNKGMKNDQNQKNNSILLFGGCKCTANVVESTVSSSSSLMVKRERISNLKNSNVGKGN